ncbi:MAG: hypothetical protein M3173_01680 [Chloroflexota bacterium]|nr:hypothetical protein [Chloroflexota bacterium]
MTSEATFIGIDALNVSAAFLRAYFLSSATQAWLQDGTRVAVGTPFPNANAALTQAIHWEYPRRSTKQGPWVARDEPTWHDPAVLIRLLHRSGCSNADGAGAALSIGSPALKHLATFRNFVAHRGEETAVKVRRLGWDYLVGMHRDPIDVVLAFGPGRPQTVIEDWLDDLHAIFGLMPA